MKSRSRAPRLLALLAVSGLGAAGCGSDDDPALTTGDPAEQGETEQPAAAEQPDDAAPAGTVAVTETALGPTLVDAEGMTLYLFTDDTDEASACIGPCAETWPPHLVDGDLEAGDGADGDLLGTVTRDDGAVQITYGGHPLYRYGPDRQPGDVEGHGVGGVWFAVAPDGSAIGSAAITGPGY